MNPMNDQEFFDLAMKVVAGHSSDAERAEFETLLASQRARKAEWQRIRAEAGVVKELLPLASTIEASEPDLPAYARERLQTKVRQTLGRPAQQPRTAWSWRWILGFAAVTAVVLVLGLPRLLRPAAPIVQIAMLNESGATRGAQTNDMSVLRDMWIDASVTNFSEMTALNTWEKTVPEGNKPYLKVIYDRTSAEVRVVGRWKGQLFQEAYPVEQGLAQALELARLRIQNELKR